MFNWWKEGMEQRGLKINTEKTKSVVTGNTVRIERGLSQENGHVDTVEEGWDQTLCFVLNVINAVTNDAQV